mmetsp:Transcript_73316/g.238610  ORF Transcript_73316/g.238610 Transcript_73316/m.238610 type:complete len:204 (+) Transcript_73316:1570-2181(+)
MQACLHCVQNCAESKPQNWTSNCLALCADNCGFHSGSWRSAETAAQCQLSTPVATSSFMAPAAALPTGSPSEMTTNLRPCSSGARRARIALMPERKPRSIGIPSKASACSHKNRTSDSARIPKAFATMLFASMANSRAFTSPSAAFAVMANQCHAFAMVLSTNRSSSTSPTASASAPTSTSTSSSSSSSAPSPKSTPPSSAEQ